MRIISIAAVVGLALLALGSCSLVRPATTALLGEARVTATLLEPGLIGVPESSRVSERYDATPEALLPAAGPVTELVEAWASRPLPSWEDEGKVNAPRVILAKLALGRDVPELNEYLQAAEPWAGVGSTWGLRPNGDYDFSLPPLTAILYQYGDRPELLYPETREHLLTVLLNQEGSQFVTTVPGSLWLVGETENHILMTEGSRYLKNQWLRRSGSDDPAHDNASNGLEAKLVEFIHELDLAGLYEFNSTPYVGYTLMALLTLDAFADPPVADAARRAIDRINFEYALSSFELRRYPPYRRQRRRAGRTDLTEHPHSAMMRVWIGLARNNSEAWAIENNTHQAVYAALMPYRLPEETIRIVLRDDDAPQEWYVTIGRGPGASPELYSSGPGYLLSAGGTGRIPRTQLVARPITLFLDDGATDLAELFTIGGEGRHEEWNNTGVLHKVAVGRAPLEVPARYEPAGRSEAWSVFAIEADRLWIATAETGSTAAILVLDTEFLAESTGDPQELADALAELTSANDLDAGRLRHPDGREIEFALEAGRDEWVITSIDGEPADRDVTTWPRLSGWRGERQ